MSLATVSVILYTFWEWNPVGCVEIRIKLNFVLLEEPFHWRVRFWIPKSRQISIRCISLCLWAICLNKFLFRKFTLATTSYTLQGVYQLLMPFTFHKAELHTVKSNGLWHTYFGISYIFLLSFLLHILPNLSSPMWVYFDMKGVWLSLVQQYIRSVAEFTANLLHRDLRRLTVTIASLQQGLKVLPYPLTSWIDKRPKNEILYYWLQKTSLQISGP